MVQNRLVMLLRLRRGFWLEEILLIHGFPYSASMCKLLVEIHSLMRVFHNLRLWRACHPILIRGSRDFLPGPSDRIQLPQLFLLRSKMYHGKRCNSWRRAAQSGLDHLGLWLLVELARIVRIKWLVLLLLLLLLLSSLLLLLLSSLLTGYCSPLLRCAWPFLASRILLCKPLFPSLRFPIVIPHASSAHNHPASKLPEHTSSSHDGNLPRTIGVREKFLRNEIIFLCLSSDYFEEGTILVEQEVRVSITQHSRAFGSQHEQFLAPVWDMESPTLVFSSIAQVSSRHHFFIAFVVKFTWYVLITFWGKLVGCVVTHSRQRFDHRLGRCRLWWGR